MLSDIHTRDIQYCEDEVSMKIMFTMLIMRMMMGMMVMIFPYQRFT